MAIGATAQMDAVRQLVREHGALRPRDLTARGLRGEYLHRLWQDGELLRVARGLYVWPDGELSQHHSLVEASQRVPGAVVCLASALRFHGIGTQQPPEVWLAMPRGAWSPRTELRLGIVHLSPSSFEAGVETHTLEGVTVRVYCPAKTIVDCFRFRHRIGLDIALEALRDGWRERRFTMDEVVAYAQTDRVAKPIRPYLEMLLCAG